MITKFETKSVISPSTNGSKSSSTLLYVIVGAVAIYLGYKYVIKPQMDKKEAEKQ